MMRQWRLTLRWVAVALACVSFSACAGDAGEDAKKDTGVALDRGLDDADQQDSAGDSGVAPKTIFSAEEQKQDMIRPLDILIALKLTTIGKPVSIRRLAKSLKLKKSAVGNALARLDSAKLLVGDSEARRPSKLALHELLTHGARYLFPAEPREWTLGLPTAHSIEPLSKELMSDLDTVVMPLEQGPVRGRHLEPIHPAAPEAAAADPDMHVLLAVVDALRIGSARERAIAGRRLKQCFAEARPT